MYEAKSVPTELKELIEEKDKLIDICVNAVDGVREKSGINDKRYEDDTNRLISKIEDDLFDLIELLKDA